MKKKYLRKGAYMRIFLLLSMLIFLLSPGVSARPEVQLNIPEYTLRLTDNGHILKEYHVAVGTPYEPTPIGKFVIAYKEKNPTWYPGSGFADKTPVPPGPLNPLGTRWIEFLPAYGIHGTDKAWSIEYPVSGGCIRMYNTDVEDLYELVDLGTPLTITYQTMVISEKADGLYLTVYPDIYSKNTTTKEQFAALISAYKQRYPIITEPKWPIFVTFPDVRQLKLSNMPKTK